MMGKSIGPYRTLAEIGVGGMGTVYRAEVVGNVVGLAKGDVVALKVVHPHLLKSQGFFKRFLREGEIGRRIRHPNVVATLDLDGIDVGGDTLLYIAMEYVEGQTLWDLFQELGSVSEELCRHFGREIAKGLEAIHALGVVHRDLKPENVMVTKDNVVKVMDLGVARFADGAFRLSATGTFVGSTLYAAPEQFTVIPRRAPSDDDDAPAAAGGLDIDLRADLHSLGVVLYELSTGVHPFDADQPAQIVKRLLEEVPRPVSEINPQLSPFFEEVVEVLLSKNRDARFSTARELVDILTEGEKSEWWRARAREMRAVTKKPQRRVHVLRETPLFGRAHELATLAAQWDRVKAGEGRVVLIEGEAGIGKSRIVDEFVAQLEAAGDVADFLVGGFPPGDAAGVADPFASAFREFFGADDVGAAAREHLAQTPILVAAFVALLGDKPVAPTEEPLTRESIQTVFIHVLRSLAASKPTILFIDDLHFAPEHGLALFAALALGIPDHRVLLVGATRPGLSESWTAGLARLPHARRIALSRLGLKDLARLLIAAVGSERLADEIGFQIVEKSDGNPFFVFEFLRSLREQGVLVTDEAGEWRLGRPVRDIGIPNSIREIVRGRIASLSEDDRDVLEVAACCGFEFDPRLVGDAMKLDRVGLLKRLAKIERAHRLVHSMGDRYVFDNHEVRDALREGVPDGLRREYHAVIADTLEARLAESASSPEGVEAGMLVELSSHFLAAGLGARGLRYVAPALDHLDRTYSADLAADLAARLLSDPDAVTGAERVDLLLRQADRLDMLGRRDQQRSVLDEALRLADEAGEPSQRARTRIGIAKWCRNLALYEDALPLAGEALEIAAGAGDLGAEAAAQAVLADVFLELGRYHDAREHIERDIELRRETGDRQGEAAATGKLGTVFRRLGRYEEAYAFFVRDLALNRAARSRIGKALVKRNLGSVLQALGRYEDARSHFARSLAIARLIGYRRGEAIALIDLGEAELMLGNPQAASQHLHAAMRLCVETGIRYVHGRALHGLAARSVVSGDPAKAFRRAKRAVRLRRMIGDRAGLAASLLLLGRLRKMAGVVKAARAAFEEAARIAQDLDLPGEREIAAAHLATLPGGDVQAGCAETEALERRLEIGDRMEAHYVLWQATGDAAHLAESSRLLEHVVRNAPEERRAEIVANVPLHRGVAASNPAWHGDPGIDSRRRPDS